jgi:uroporphyrinogen-III synthase
VSIGPETTRVAGEAGLAIVAEATTPDVAGLVEAARRALGTS